MKSIHTTQLLDLKKGVKSLKKELEKHKQRIVDLKVERDEKIRENSKLKKELKTVKGMVKTYKEEVDMLYEVIKTLEEEKNK